MVRPCFQQNPEKLDTKLNPQDETENKEGSEQRYSIPQRFHEMSR